MKFDFFDRVVSSNKYLFNNFKKMVFFEGMLFGSYTKWWDVGERKLPHEGIDIICFLDGNNKIRKMAPTTNIPALCVGQVVDICKDFLGFSVFVESIIEDRKFIWAFGHIVPNNRLKIGSLVYMDEPMGQIASLKKGKVPSHLHLSIGILNKTPQKFNWDVMNDNAFITLIDPLKFISGQYAIKSGIFKVDE